MQVEDVVRIMEMELGEGWILDEQCKVAKIFMIFKVSNCSSIKNHDGCYKILSFLYVHNRPLLVNFSATSLQVARNLCAPHDSRYIYIFRLTRVSGCLVVLSQ